MTDNISYLSEYEPYDGGYVSFGQGGGKITGKCIIKTGKLEFENIYFVKEPKYNLFSVSQICDNKVSVPFTDSECIVLGKDFKLKDDTNVLLRTPRQHNMYSIDLNNIVPHKNLTCLVAKPLLMKESNIRHLARPKMNEFCTKKGIKREFSNTKTPQQNRVAERKNRTLIEASRTMLADAKLPVTFWAEAVNNACYVQYRVLVNKSQNKTPYELFNSRTPAIGFLRPFGCHNKLIKKGAGPNWLFDIDTLTNPMNYVSVVVAGTSSTNISSTKDVASQAVKKDVSSLRYIALLNWFHEAHMESSNNDAQDACNANVSKSSGISNSTATSKIPTAEQMESLTVKSEFPTVSSPILTVFLDTSPETISGSRLISKEVISQEETLSLDNALTLPNWFEDTIGVEADLSNMKSSIPASPTPTFRIHKDHPKSQIIGPMDTHVQNRHKSKEMEEHSFISTIHQKTTPDLIQFCLFLCFLSQEEPKKIFDALKDPSWIEAMQEELLQFKIQNV
nr:hypothetical protein [Tanacetum cinerariifolium]